MRVAESLAQRGEHDDHQREAERSAESVQDRAEQAQVPVRREQCHAQHGAIRA